MKTKYLKHSLAKQHIFLKSHYNEISKVLITSDSQYIITSSRDKTIRIWNFQNKRLETILKGHGGGISCIAITSDNNYLVSGSSDNKLIIWNLQTRTQESILGGHTHYIRCIDITSDDLYIISTSFDSTIRIWSLTNRSQEILIRDRTPMDYKRHICISKSNKFIAYPFDSDLVIMDLSLKIQEILLKMGGSLRRNGHIDRVESIAITTDDQFIITGHSDGIIKISRKISGRFLKGHTKCVHILAITHDNLYLISNSYDCTVIIWSIPLREQISLFQENSAVLISPAITPDNKYLIFASIDGLLQHGTSKRKRKRMFLKAIARELALSL